MINGYSLLPDKRVLREAITQAVIDANKVLASWRTSKPALLNATDVRSLITHHISRCVNRTLGWRHAKGLFRAYPLIVNASSPEEYVEYPHVTGIYIMGAKHIGTSRAELINLLTEIFDSIDYESLAKKGGSGVVKQVKMPSSIVDISFDTIKQIKF